MQNPPPDPQQYPPNYAPNYAPGYAPPYSQPVSPTQPYSQPGYGQPSYGQPSYGQPGASSPPYASVAPAPYPAYAPPRPAGDVTTALVLEAVCAVFGIYGIGWMYRGRVGTGILLLVLGFAWAAFMAISVVVTGGLAAICVGPLHLVFIVIDVLQFNNAQRRM